MIYFFFFFAWSGCLLEETDKTNGIAIIVHEFLTNRPASYLSFFGKPIIDGACPAGPYLETECPELEDELHREENCEDDVEHVQKVCVALGLAVELHGQAEGVQQNHCEYSVLKEW